MFRLEPLRLWMSRDIHHIIENLTPEEQAKLRGTSKAELARFHRGLGTGLRNAFRSRRFPGLSAFCHAVVRRSNAPPNPDILSAVAIREVWRALQSEP